MEHSKPVYGYDIYIVQSALPWELSGKRKEKSASNIFQVTYVLECTRLSTQYIVLCFIHSPSRLARVGLNPGDFQHKFVTRLSRERDGLQGRALSILHYPRVEVSSIVDL